jgi:hypothetical protein
MRVQCSRRLSPANAIRKAKFAKIGYDSYKHVNRHTYICCINCTHECILYMRIQPRTISRYVVLSSRTSMKHHKALVVVEVVPCADHCNF